MSKDSSNTKPVEVDLSHISNSIGVLSGKIQDKFFRFLFFLKKQSLKIILIIIITAAIGAYLDYRGKAYRSTVIISSSYSGNDYLYSKVKTVESKLEERDTMFFKGLGIKNPQQIKKIEIKPIIGVYSFINSGGALPSNAQNTPNFEMIKLLSESSDIQKVLKDEITSKNYPNHSINIITKDKITEEDIVEPLLKYLNTDEYLDEVIKISVENTIIETKSNDKIISQIDTIIRAVSKNIEKSKASSLIVNNEDNELSALLSKKKDLQNENLGNRLRMLDMAFIVRNISQSLNLRETEGLHGKLKFVFPIVSIFLYFTFRLLAFGMVNYQRQKQ